MRYTEDSKDYIQFHKEYGCPRSPLDREKVRLILDQGGQKAFEASAVCDKVMLNGEWKVIADCGNLVEDDYINGEAVWNEPIDACVPCSVQAALLQNGMIPDPMLGKNNLDIEWIPEKKWWLKKTFRMNKEYIGGRHELVFCGIDYYSTIWLNGKKLGCHEGMFGGPEFYISNILRFGDEENVLIVSIDPAPSPVAINGYPYYFKNLKASVVYGWHYVRLISLGIWQDVFIRVSGSVQFCNNPFLATASVDGCNAEVELSMDVVNYGIEDNCFSLIVSLKPKNFTGDSFWCETPLVLKPGKNELGYKSRIENIQLWWPYDMGSPNLYTFDIKLMKDGIIYDEYQTGFGFRTVWMEPAKIGPRPFLYNWQMVVNGKSIWLKGANWASPDPLLRYDKNRYERFLLLAKCSNIHLLRVWGGGPIETDIFYDMCDEMGIMVWQEFPMHHSHLTDEIPLELGEDIVGHVVPRLRNRACLVVWCGANEQYHSTCFGTGRIIDYIGKRCLELDGSRVFRKSCPYGGDIHEYITYWDGKPVMDNLTVLNNFKAGEPRGCDGYDLEDGPIAVTEWGVSSPANIETLKRVLPPDELETWPLIRDGAFVHHTPTYDAIHIDKMIHCASNFIDVRNLENLIIGSQKSQSFDYKLVIERMRSKKPYTTGTFFYKLTENYPACSWATIDYYGAPKRSHYAIKHAYEPIHAMLLFNNINAGRDGGLPVQLYAVNDTFLKHDLILKLKVYDHELVCIEQMDYEVIIQEEQSLSITEVNINNCKQGNDIVFLYLEMGDINGSIVSRNWYCFNFENSPQSLWNRKKTQLQYHFTKVGDSFMLEIRNNTNVPAIDVFIDLGAASNTYFCEDNEFWMEPFEERRIRIERTNSVDHNDVNIDGITLKGNNIYDIHIL